MIPKNIHLIFLRKEEPFPSLFQNCLDRIKAFHPSWTITLYNEEEIQVLLREHAPEWLTIYNSFQYNIQKADFLRVLLLYLFGGFYLDLDIYCLHPLDGLTSHSLVLAEEKTISNTEKLTVGLQHRLRVANYMFGGIAGHPFWLEYMKQMIKRICNPVVSQNDIFETTGPGLLTNIYHREKYFYQDITLLRNTDRRCARPHHNDIACYFGNFAAHLHSGTWRADVGREVPAGLTDRHSTLNGLIPEKIFNPEDIQSSLYIEPLNYNSSLMLWPNLYVLYKVFRSVSNPLPANSTKSKKQISFYFDIEEAEIPMITGSQNVLFVATHNYATVKRNMAYINTLFKICIVPDSFIGQQLKMEGISIPIHMVPVGFEPVKRLFDQEVNTGTSSFIIGFSLTGNEKRWTDIVSCFSKLKETGIPNLKLSVLHGYSNKMEVYKTIGKDEKIPSWIEFKSKKRDVSKWFQKIDTYLSFYLQDVYEFGPRVSLYSGVPTIVMTDKLIEEYDFLPYCMVVREELSDAIKEVCFNYSYWSERAVEGAARMEIQYSNERFKTAVIHLLNQQNYE